MKLTNDDLHFLDLLHIGIMTLSPELKVTYCNKWLQRRLVNMEKLNLGTPVSDLFIENADLDRLEKALDESNKFSRSHLLSDKLNNLPFILSLNETYLNYNLYISPLCQSEKSEKGVLLQFLDITPVKRREDYLQKKQKELAQQQSLAFAQERMSSLGELTSSIAHEINNPLAMLELGNRILLKELGRESINKERIIENIEQNSKIILRISDLIRGVRNLSRQPNNDDFQQAPLVEILKDIEPVFTQLFKTTGIKLDINFDSEILNTPIPLVRVLVSQIFMNLFNNAVFEIKKKQHENPFVSISGTMDAHNLYVTFTDSGEGIPKEIAEKIFLPFYTTKDFGEGTGLGLSTIYKIMSNHKGKIEINHDCPNTQFVLTFPRK